jgi:hypothetical protein
MMSTEAMRLVWVGVLLSVASTAWAKLPAPDGSPEAKAKRAEAAAKTAWSNKVADFQLCRSQDRAAAHYLGDLKKRGAVTPDAAASMPAVAIATCADPGPFAYTPETAAAPRPLEAAGAHSPTKTASTPPNTTTPAAAQGAAPVKK